MPAVDWRGEDFDCFLLHADRLMVWGVDRLILKSGLTGDKEVTYLWMVPGEDRDCQQC